jgi:hypothetical protein
MRVTCTFLLASHRYSFIDVWMVLITAVAVRFTLADTQTKEQVRACAIRPCSGVHPAITSTFSVSPSSFPPACARLISCRRQNKLSDFVNVSTSIDLLIWIQGYALSGAYIFSGAIFASQCVGHLLMQVAMAYTWLRTPVPLDARARSKSSCCCKTRCYPTRCLGFECLRPLAKYLKLPRWAHLCFVALVFLVIAGLGALVWYSMNVDIMNVSFHFKLPVEIDEEAEFKIELPSFLPDIKVGPINGKI